MAIIRLRRALLLGTIATVPFIAGQAALAAETAAEASAARDQGKTAPYDQYFY